MLREMAVLLIVLWGSQLFSTSALPVKHYPKLSELYCNAKLFLQKYKSVDRKHLPLEIKPTMASVFSQPGCNFTRWAEKCQTLREFKELFVWLKNIHREDELLDPVMESFTSLVELQESYVKQKCPTVAEGKAAQITCRNYTHTPLRENMFHYIFELYRDRTHQLLSSELKLAPKNTTAVCASAKEI